MNFIRSNTQAATEAETVGASAGAQAGGETVPAQHSDDDLQLSVTGLHKQFGSEFELSAIDLDVGTDEIVALLGPSGCGKTTALRCIAGVETPDGGEIVVDGERVFGDGVETPPEKRDVGMVYQNYAIWPHKSVYENVVFPLKHGVHDVPRNEYEGRVDEMLELMEISDLKHSPATDLSGGQQQRTALARSLVHDPDLLLLDEPLSNLDKELRKHMRYELQRLQHEIGVSILYVTHDQEEAFYLADRVLVMNDGEIVERGNPRQLYEQPKSPFTRQFIGVSNKFTGTVERDGEGTKIVRSGLVDFPLATAEYAAENIDDGDVVCFLRPRDIAIERCVDDVGDRMAVTGTVVAKGVLGERYEVTVQFDGRDLELNVHTENCHRFDRGEKLTLLFSPEHLQVYDPTD